MLTRNDCYLRHGAKRLEESFALQNTSVPTSLTIPRSMAFDSEKQEACFKIS